VRCTLDELQESLGETYERALKEPKKPNRPRSPSITGLVAIRLLGVEEHAEVLAVDFDDADGTQRFEPELAVG
jgi:hypothetical protein